VNDTIYSVLQMNCNPSTKLGLIVLILEERPMTTKELNYRLNCLKTYQNYLDLFEDQIASGIVSIVQMKNTNGITRNHFCVNTDKLIRIEVIVESNKVKELRELGYDITTIIEGTKNEKLLKNFHKVPLYSDVVIPDWTEEDIITFSNTVYNIVIKYKKD